MFGVDVRMLLFALIAGIEPELDAGPRTARRRSEDWREFGERESDGGAGAA